MLLFTDNLLNLMLVVVRFIYNLLNFHVLLVKEVIIIRHNTLSIFFHYHFAWNISESDLCCHRLLIDMHTLSLII
jgi:hypothetical protein